jgi:non-ribosomal peptide synthetase component F
MAEAGAGPRTSLAFSPAASAASANSRIDGARPLSVIRDSSPLRWRYGERLDDVIEDAWRRFGDRLAVDVDGANVSFRELDARANQMARFFLANGVKPGDRVAVLLDRGAKAYAALFALMKVRATFVPLDANHPPERVGYVLRDASVSLIVTHLRMADRFIGSAIPRLILDKARREIAQANDAPLGDHERAPTAEALCYVLYTSGTTGHPKGVAVAHSSICNFVRVAAERYGFGPGDRVYQGMSIAFDFSVEELWVPLVAGATIVPNAGPTTLFDGELAEFLEQIGDLSLLRAHPARLPRARLAEATYPAHRRRSLSASPRQALEPAGAGPAQQLRPHRDNGDRDPRATVAGEARDHRPAVTDLFDRHP